MTYQLIQLYPLQIFLTLVFSNIRKDMRQGMWHIWGRRELHTKVLWGNVKERDHLGHLGTDGEINIKMDLIEIR
jgi:hypothetical protein